MIVASTVSTSREELTARKTSSRACNSVTERVSASVRSFNSPSNRVFSIAITAWSAKVRTSSICRSVKGSMRWRARTMTPIGNPSRISGTPTFDRTLPIRTDSGTA